MNHSAGRTGTANPVVGTPAGELVQVECVDDPSGRVSIWHGSPQDLPEGRSFGGLLLGQSLLAAGRTVPPGHRVISQQADFVAAVPTDQSLVWEVTRLADSRSLSTRRSRLLAPDGAELFAATTRWSTERDDLPSHMALRPCPAPDPETLRDLHEHFEDAPHVPAWWRVRRPIHVRHVVPPSHERPGPETDEQTIFVRSADPVAADPALRAAVVAYASDMCLIEPAFTALGALRHVSGGLILSLTHVLTFHAPLDLSQWSQYDCKVHKIARGRAQGHGDLFDPSGRLAVSAQQLALIRVPPPQQQ